jgi:segregation and condensation protein B
MARPRAAPLPFDRELATMPQELRWREWMGRVEAAIFAGSEPVSREILARLVGADCVLDELIADIRDELKARPYDLASVSGGWQHRTRPRFAEAILAAGLVRADAAPDLSQTERLVATAIAYRQPATRAMLSEWIGRDISRDLLAHLKQTGLITTGPRAPEPGAPATYVTTRQFLSIFGLQSLRDLPELDLN